jgi:hypothetical protein
MTYVNLNHAGVQPFIRNTRPSRLKPSLTTCITWSQSDQADFAPNGKTSYRGPFGSTLDPALQHVSWGTGRRGYRASKEGGNGVCPDIVWELSPREDDPLRGSISAVKSQYWTRTQLAELAGMKATHGAIWETSFHHGDTVSSDPSAYGQGVLLMSTLLTIFADKPLPNTLTPSSLPMRYKPVTAFEYRKRSVLGLAASAHMRTRMTYGSSDCSAECLARPL